MSLQVTNSTLSPCLLNSISFSQKVQADIYREILKKVNITYEDLQSLSAECLKEKFNIFTKLFKESYPCAENPSSDQIVSLVNSDLFTFKKINLMKKDLTFPEINPQFYKKITGREAAGNLENFTSSQCFANILERFTKLFEKIYPCETNPTFNQTSEVLKNANLTDKICLEISDDFSYKELSTESSSKNQTYFSVENPWSSLHYLIATMTAALFLIFGTIVLLRYIKKHRNFEFQYLQLDQLPFSSSPSTSVIYPFP